MAEGVGAAGGLGQEARLSDARFPGHQHGVSFAQSGLVCCSSQGVEMRRAADQDRAKNRSFHRYRGDFGLSSTACCRRLGKG